MELDRETMKKLEVSDESRKAATKCSLGCSCLDGDRKDLCPVVSCVDAKVFFVQCLNEDACFYRHNFGLGHFCTCPVRQELFIKHGV
jgi:hypothetical protein